MTETVGLVTGMAPRKKQLWRKSSPGESGAFVGDELSPRALRNFQIALLI